MESQPNSATMSSDLTFITNEQGKHLGDRFGVLLGDDTRLFDCLVGYLFISGFPHFIARSRRRRRFGFFGTN
jgi:hypothetical protein